ncbi:hypothetical protein OAE43_00965 [Akkermansiaceae bacterium]|nr:hypothetical protein [Akkermansiaceae bacterium]MDB4792313.1 hypothetical protein [bacterium]
MKNEWFQVPEELQVDPVIAFLIKQRRQASDTLRDADETLKNYVLRNAREVPEDLLPGLTKLQSESLDFIVSFYLQSGQSPTSGELMKYMEWKSNNSAVNCIKSLTKKGYIHKTKGRWRSLVPLFNSKRERVKQKKKPNK